MQGQILAFQTAGHFCLVATSLGSIVAYKFGQRKEALHVMQKQASFPLQQLRTAATVQLTFTALSNLTHGPAVLVLLSQKILILRQAWIRQITRQDGIDTHAQRSEQPEVGRLEMQTGALTLAAEAQLPHQMSSLAKFSPPLLGGPVCLTIATLDHSIQLITLNNSRCRIELSMRGHSVPISDIAWNEEGNILASADCAGEVKSRRDCNCHRPGR